MAATTADDQTAAFFEGLAETGDEPMLARTSGTLRFDLREGKKTNSWYVTIVKGDVTVSRSSSDADAIVTGDKTLFDEMATGRANATTAILRGVLEAEGDLGLMMSFQRLFPAPPKSVYARKIK